MRVEICSRKGPYSGEFMNLKWDSRASQSRYINQPSTPDLDCKVG